MFTNKKHEEGTEALKLGNLDLAIALYTEALELAPNDCNILSDRGVAYLHKQERVNCFADFDAAIKLQPNYAFRYAARAFAKNNFGDIDGAVQDYETAVNLDPKDAVAQNNLGLLLEQKGYKKEAEERFNRADKLSEMEDGLYEVIDELEGEQSEKNEIQQPISSPITDQDDSNTGKEIKKLFTSKSQFKEFLNFVKNGFKLK